MRKRFEQASAVYTAALAALCASCTLTEAPAPSAQSNAISPPSALSAQADPIDFGALDRLIGDAHFVILGEAR